jgi:lysophospholipase
MTVDRFSEPAAFQWGFITNADGARLRTGYVAPQGTVKGTVVLLPGFRECTEKYFEVIRDFLSRGYAVATFDWSGQGGSDRLLKAEPQKAHGQPYEHHIRDLALFLSTLPPAQDPLIMAAHSMGAHIGLRYMADHPGVFDRAVLSSPMIDVLTGAMPKNFARSVAKLAESSGAGAKYIPGGHDWTPQKEAFQDNPRTSDPVRFANIHDIYAQKPDLKTGDPTYSWIHHTFQSIDALSDPAVIKKIAPPILMQVSRKDTIVDRTAQDRAAPLMQNCKVVEIADARHEIWMERDELRQLWLAEIDRFLAKPASPRPGQDISPPKL